MSADNETLLEIVDDVSRALTGRAAAASGNRPIKTELISVCNDVIKDLCRGKNYYFLNTKTDIVGYTTSTTTDTTTTVSGTAAFTSGDAYSLYNDDSSNAQSVSFTSDADYLSKPISVTIPLGLITSFVGLANQTLTLKICPDSNGSPDTSNPIVTATSIVVTNNNTDTSILLPGSNISDVTFTFPSTELDDTDDILKKNTTYWMYLTTTPASNDGMGISWGTVGGTFKATLNFYQASYTTELTIPATYEKVYRIYSGTSSAPTCNLIPYAYDEFMFDPEDIPDERFALRTFSSGTLLAYINASVEAETWTVEGKIYPTALSSDSDVPVIPRGYRDLIKKEMELVFISRGLGNQDASYIQLLMKQVDEGVKDMRKNFLYHPKTSFIPIRGGGVGTQNGDNTPNRFFVDDGITRPKNRELTNDAT